MPDLSLHAARQAARRGITLAEIDEALTGRSTSYRSRQAPDKLVVLGATHSGRRLKIVVLVANPSFIVTVADRDSED